MPVYAWCMNPFLRRAGAVSLALVLAACATGPTQPAGPAPRSVADAPATVAASTAHPLATQAALQMLAEGGSAADALVAAQAVLGLVEPQSSGFGGGALLLLWEPATKRLHSYDGLAAAPVQATAGLRNDLDGRLLPLDAVVRGGRSIGVPGAPALLHELHAKHGLLPWSRLFDPALKLARGGTWDWFVANGGITDDQVHQVLGDLPDRKVNAARAQGLIPPRLALLAREAWKKEIYSEGQLTRLLQLNRHEIREILDGAEKEESEANELVKLPH